MANQEKPTELPLLKGQTRKTSYVFKQDKLLIVLPVAADSDNLPILLICPYQQMSGAICVNVKLTLR